jgi:hypothetical protein
MRRLTVADCPDDMVLARRVHGDEGVVILEAGASIGPRERELLAQRGINDILVVRSGEELPDITLPAYMDRYAEDFAPRLHAVFKDTLAHREMQELFLKALDHATACYRRYRLDPGEGSPTP